MSAVIESAMFASLCAAMDVLTDGGLTIYIGPKSPGLAKESNWLPSAASGPYTLTFRTYGPQQEILDQKCFPPRGDVNGINNLITIT